LVIAELKSNSTLEYIPYDKAYSKGFEDMRRRKPSTDKLRELAGWEPEYSLEQIIADVAKEMQKQ
jgi:UDP-glucose 4-epimerase